MCAPAVRVTSNRRGAKSTIIPAALSERQRTRGGILAILTACDGRNERGFHIRLAREIVDILDGKSAALKRKEEIHRTAMVNRANVYVPLS